MLLQVGWAFVQNYFYSGCFYGDIDSCFCQQFPGPWTRNDCSSAGRDIPMIRLYPGKLPFFQHKTCNLGAGLDVCSQPLRRKRESICGCRRITVTAANFISTPTNSVNYNTWVDFSDLLGCDKLCIDADCFLQLNIGF